MAVVIVGVAAAAVGAIAAGYKYFSRPAATPVTVENAPLTQEQMIQAARDKLGMDCKSYYNFAVCGRSGVGKSTFLNCMRNVDDVKLDSGFRFQQHGPAPIGITETTAEATPYCFPNNTYEYLRIWDIPGGDTPDHPGETYFEDKLLYAFDALLLLRKDRFTALDLLICKKARQYKRPILIVMTCADQAVETELRLKKQKKRKILTQEEKSQTIRETKQQLKDNAVKELSKASFQYILNDIPMFVVAPQSYRDSLRDLLEPDSCPPLEMEQLLEHCFALAVKARPTI